MRVGHRGLTTRTTATAQEPEGVIRGESSTHDPAKSLAGITDLPMSPGERHKHDTTAYTYQDLVAYLEPFNIAAGLRLIGLWNTWLTRKNAAHVPIGPVPVTAWWLALVARALIEGGTIEGGRVPTDEDLLRACYRAYCIHDPIVDREGRSREAQAAERRAFDVRVAYEQFGYQHMPLNAVARTLALYRELPKRVPGDPALDLAGLFKDATGVTLDRFLMIGYLFYGWVTSGDPAIGTENLRGLGDPVVSRLWTEGSIGAFLARAACGVDEFRHLQTAENAAHPGLERYALNVLRRRPIIEVAPGSYVVPSAQLLLERFTGGIYYDLYDHCDYGNKDKPFSTYFGALFEQYIGDLLMDGGRPPTIVLAEIRYNVGKQPWDGADWTVVDADAAALIEVKAKRLVKNTKVSGGAKELNDDLLKAIVPAIAKLQAKEAHARGGLAGQPDLGRAKRFHRVVAVYDALYPLPVVKPVIDRALPPEYDGGPYSVLWSEEVESLAALMPHVPMTTLLAEWEALPVEGRQDFRWWLTERWRALGLGVGYPQNAYLQRLFDEFPGEVPNLPD